jgi:hypothetical protein
MPAGNSSNGSFAYIARQPDGKAAAGTLSKLCKQLRNAGADGAADRFEAIDSKIANGNRHFDDLERHIDPDRAVDELNSARGRPRWRNVFHGDLRRGLRPLLGLPKSVRFAHLLRNVAALTPLIFTWVILGLAAEHYDSDLKNHPRIVNEPFLLLWQQGFGSGFPSFERVTIIDFSLLALVVLLTFWVHWTEGQADRSADSVYKTVDSLKSFLADRRSLPTPLTPLTPEQWAEITSETLSKTVLQTQELNAASELAIKEASDRLKAIQDTSRELIGDFKDAVLQTLTSVREQNEHFIENTRETNQQVLQALVEQQMQPLLNQVQDMLNEFRTQQVAYTDAVTGLTTSVGAIDASSAALSGSVQAIDGSTSAIAGSLAAMASSQQRFAANVEGSAQSMSTAAAAMTEVKDTLRTDLLGRLQEMTGNITSASTSLEQAQTGLASTTQAMNTAATAFAETADGWATALKEPMDLLRLALSQGGSVGRRRRRRFLIFGRRS